MCIVGKACFYSSLISKGFFLLPIFGPFHNRERKGWWLVLLLEYLRNFFFYVAGSFFFSQLVTQEQTHPFSRFSRTHYRKKERKKGKFSKRERERKERGFFFASFFLGVLLGDLDFCEFCIFLSNGRNSCPFGK